MKADQEVTGLLQAQDHHHRRDRVPGDEIYLKFDQSLTHDINAVMCYPALEGMGIKRVRTEVSVSYLDRNPLYVNTNTPDDHIFLTSIARKYGIMHSVQYARFGIGLTLPQGSFTALVGPSGGGKSTVAKLIARFWDVTAGSITIGGVDVRDMPLAQLSGLVSFVTQDNYLFRCSLLENIRLGSPSATDEEVKAAARAAQCEEFIAKLPQGYDTPAGEAGKRLSGGEKQRIAIARMLLKNAPIVILDEATASIDPENEHLIQSALSELTRGKTIITIAHRLATIEQADQILVVDDGRIVEKGTHAQLIAQPGRYQQFVRIREKAEGWKL